MSATDRDFITLFADSSPAVLAWAQLQIHPPLRRKVDPEDIVQEACARAYHRFSDFDPARGNFRNWLFGIARNVLKEAFRSLRDRGESVFAGHDASGPGGIDAVPADATSLTSRIAREDEFQVFMTAAENLPDVDRRMLLYRGLEGREHTEVAKILDLSLDATEKRWQRLCEKLRSSGVSQRLFAT